jgi:hypothetical protein
MTVKDRIKEAYFSAAGTPLQKMTFEEERDDHGRWTASGGESATKPSELPHPESVSHVYLNHDAREKMGVPKDLNNALTHAENDVQTKSSQAKAEIESAKHTLDNASARLDQRYSDGSAARLNSLGELQGAGPRVDSAVAARETALDSMNNLRALADKSIEK